MIEKEVTIYDIASKLNISPATVSRAVNDHPAIRRKTKDKIRELALQLGYRYNTQPKFARMKQTSTIGVIAPRLNSNFMSSLLAGVERVANREKYNVIIGTSSESVKKEITESETMFKTRVDGLLVSLALDTENFKHFEPFFRKSIPVIFFDRVPDLESVNNIFIDNYKAAYKATQHLVDQGCKNIFHISSIPVQNVYKDRLGGYRRALEDNGFKYQQENVIIGNLSQEFGLEAAEIILKMKKKPDGIFVSNDNCATACMLRMKKAGYKIPADIAFVGFNNDPVATIVEPNLTSINYPGFEMGEVAAQNLVNLLKGIQPGTSYPIIIESELIIRSSSKRK